MRQSTNVGGSQKGGGLLLCLLLVWVFDGALRKWLAPGLARPLFFLDLPFVFLIYLAAFRSRQQQSAQQGHYFGAALLLSISLALLQAWHVLANDQSGSNALFGWIMYCGLILLPVALPKIARRQEVERAMVVMLRLSWPMALLTIAQVKSSADSFLNRSFVEGLVPLGTSRGTVRASGTFSSATGMGQFIVLSIVALVVISSDPKRHGMRVIGAYAAPILLMLFLAGSRTAVFEGGLVLAIFVTSQLLIFPGRALRTLLTLVLLAAVGFGLARAVAPDALSAFGERFQQASATQSTSGRIISGITSAGGVLDIAPSWGSGLGAFSRASVGYYSANWIEDEPARIVMEAGPTLGLLILALRYIMLLWLGWLCVTYAARDRRLAPFAFLAQAGPLLVTGQITGQGDTNLVFWLIASMILCWGSDSNRSSIRISRRSIGGERTHVIGQTSTSSLPRVLS